MHRWDQASFPRRELRARMLRAARRNWVPLVGAANIIALGAIPVTLVFHGYARGLVHGLIVGLGASGLFLVLLLASGSTRFLTGAWGEENTRDELRRLRRRGVIVDWVDGLAIDGGDVDHLVLTRGGVSPSTASGAHLCRGVQVSGGATPRLPLVPPTARA